MKRQFIVCLLLIMAISVQSCKDKTSEWLDRTPIFRVLGPNEEEEGVLTIDGKAQNVQFTVLATEAWSAEVADETYKISPNSGGSGKTTVELITPSNESGAARETVVSFISETQARIEFKLVQEEQLPYIEISPNSRTVMGDGEELVVSVSTNQSSWTYDLGEAASWIAEKDRTDVSVTLVVDENTSGQKRSADIRFYAVEAPELMDYLEIVQNVPAVAPVADLLDIVFSADGTAEDKSPMQMEVDNTRLNADCSTVYLDKYQRYAAQFNNATIARSGLTSGYYLIPYTIDSDFGKKLSDGYSYELLFCTYYDPTGLAQVKPFASTQAGGTGMCFRANNGEINFETHVGGAWKELYSGIIPIKNEYYHVVATWNKEEGTALLYVNGVLAASVNATGEFQFMTTNVDKRWFGIGADPSQNDTGEASFYGEVVIARLYDAPMSADEVYALYKLVK